MVTEIFKALHGSTPIYIKDLFEEKDKIYNLRLTISIATTKVSYSNLWFEFISI